jgi:CxxC-x17-CxxC domain-containing protein
MARKKEVEETPAKESEEFEEEEESEEASEEVSEEPSESKASESRGFGEREMHKIKCSECGKDAEVPFKPIEGRPVYCRDCFMKHRPRRSFGGGGRSFGGGGYRRF